MLQHYIKFAIRNFRSNKVIFIGSLATLCLGALCISLLFSYVHNELTMDDFHEREQDIYAMVMKVTPKSEWRFTNSESLSEFNYNEYSELENLVTVQKYKEKEIRFTYNNLTFSPEGIVADSSFFKVFDFELKIGNQKNALSNPDGLLITEDFAKKMFGKENPIGKQVKVISNREALNTVTGIIKRLPSNSSITFDFILPSSNIPNKYSRTGTSFLLANPNFNKEEFIKKIEDKGNNVKNRYPQHKESKTSIVGLESMYFNKELASTNMGPFSKAGDKQNINILIIIIFVILCISVLNFSNLQIINVNTNVKHAAINLVNGAKKQHVSFQRITEMILLIIFSTILISIGYRVILPYFNDFTGVKLVLPLWMSASINSSISLLIIVLGLLYPMILISRITIINSLKKTLFFGSHLAGKKMVVIIQYSLTLILLVASIIVTNQLDLMLSKDLGFKSDNIIKTKLFYDPPRDPNWQTWSKEKLEKMGNDYLAGHQYIVNQLKSQSSIVNFSQGNSPLNVYPNVFKSDNNEDEFTTKNMLVVTPSYLETFGIELVEGEFYKEKDPASKSRKRKIVINEAAKKYWNIDDISKAKLIQKGRGSFEIMGVVKDFNYEHLSSKPKPLILYNIGRFENDFFIQLQEGKIQEGLQYIEALFNKVNPGETFQYSFLSDEIAALYQKEKRLSTIYIVFTIIALLISAIGLFTIALYDTQRRIKEIGIRKVNGATITEIMLMLNKDFIKWVFIAFIIACPIAYYAMSKWLENFAYKTALSWWVFALAGVFTFVIALVTVSWQTYRAATRNPVESLRDE